MRLPCLALVAALAAAVPAAPAQQAPADFREYNNVTEWIGTITYAFEDSWTGKLGAATITGQRTESGEVTLHLDQIQSPGPAGVEWRGAGSVSGTARQKERMDAGKVSTDAAVTAKGTYKALNAWLTMDYAKGTFKAGCGCGSHEAERTVRMTFPTRTTNRTEKTAWTPCTDKLIEDPLPRPAPGMILAAGKTSAQPGGGFPPAFQAPVQVQSQMKAYWSIAPVWRDLELVVTVDGYESWIPEGGFDPSAPGNSVTAHAVLRTKDGKPLQTSARKITFELLDVSREPGVCLNWPPPPATPPSTETYDLIFDPARNPGMAFADATCQVLSRVGNGVTKADAVIGCYDWGAVGDLKVTAELVDGRVIAGHLDGRPELFRVPLPKRKAFSKIADAWKADPSRSLDEEDSWDEDDEPKPPKAKGDGLTLYEEYRGVHLADGKHARLDPHRMELFVLDPDKLLDATVWKQATGVEALLLKDDQHRGQRVNFNSKEKPKYAVKLMKVQGLADPEGTANELFIWGQTDEAVADKPTRCRIFVDRPANGLQNVLHVKIRNALADPQSADGQLLTSDGFTPALLQGADKALSDPSIVAALVARLVSSVVVHELGHACDVSHHKDDTKGAMGCPMRNLDGHDKQFRMAQELVSPSTGPLPLGIKELCTAPDNCWGKVRLKNK